MVCGYTVCTHVQVFSLPPDGATTEYQISNRRFSDFLHTYHCDFPKKNSRPRHRPNYREDEKVHKEKMTIEHNKKGLRINEQFTFGLYVIRASTT